MTTGVVFAEGCTEIIEQLEERAGKGEEEMQAAVGRLRSGAGSELAPEPGQGPPSRRADVGLPQECPS